MGEILTKQEGRGRERKRGCKILETSGERLVEKQGDHRRETGRFSYTLLKPYVSAEYCFNKC